MDTIFALSSGQPPAGIGVIRMTGPQVRHALEQVVGFVPEPRMARRAIFRDASRETLDDGLVIFFAGPKSVSGEDLAEFHCHGGRAIIAAMEETLSSIEGCRRAQPGEFTRRAFANGRIDLSEAEGLADLLSAETELQRRSAVAMAGGVLSRQAEDWRGEVLRLSRRWKLFWILMTKTMFLVCLKVSARRSVIFACALHAALKAPHAETLREGFRVALAGPPNAGKSTLFNALVESEAAITAEIAGTTRDVLTRSVSLGGVPFTFVDMAGLRDESDDAIEVIGIDRAHGEIASADLVLWLGEEGMGPGGAWEIEAQIDRPGHTVKPNAHVRLSAKTGEGMAELRNALIELARQSMPKAGEAVLNQRQRQRLGEALAGLNGAQNASDPLLVAENLRLARQAFDALIGRTSTEDVLDTLFGRFCIGK